jgi:spermidine/putrescine transport system substrate-binding protein
VDREPTSLNVLAPGRLRPTVEAATRREVLIAGIAGTAALLGAAGCGGSSTTATSNAGAGSGTTGMPIEHTLNLGNWSSYDDPRDVKGYSSKYAVTVNPTYYASNEEMITKLQAGGGRDWDVIAASQNVIEHMVASGWIQKLTKAWIPNFKYVDPSALNVPWDNGRVYTAPKDFGLTGFGYRTDIVTDQPVSWTDFFQILHKYKGKGGINLLQNPASVVTSALQALGHSLNSTNPSEYAEALKLLKSIKPYVTTVDSSNYRARMIDGSVIISQGWNGDFYRIHSARPTVRWQPPQPISEAWMDNWTIQAQAPDPGAAHAWVNYFLDPKIAAREAQYVGYSVPLTGIDKYLPAAYAKSPIVNPPPTVYQNYEWEIDTPQVLSLRSSAFNSFMAA